MIEPLENRIAPAALTGNVLTYTDYDGDLVKITFTHATMAPDDFFFSDGTHINGDTTTQEGLTSISMTGHTGGGFTLTARQQHGQGDGRANIGTITSTATSLGKISIDGDLALGSFTSGSATTAAIQSLTVNSLGANVTTDNTKVEFQGIGSLTVKNDLSNVALILDASSVVTKSLVIDGDVIGGTFTDSAHITAHAPVASMHIGGSVIGAAGLRSGVVDLEGGGLNSLTVGGSILRGAYIDKQSGILTVAGQAQTIQIGGDITGIVNFGNAKTVTVTGGVLGSAVDSEGDLYGGTVGTLSVGSIRGGLSNGGGTYGRAGYVEISGDIGTLKIPGGIFAGENVNGAIRFSGMINVDGSVGTAVIGSLEGNFSQLAYISVKGVAGQDAIKTLKITHGSTFGSIVAGFGTQYVDDAGAPVDSGFGSITIGGNFTTSFITAGSNSGSDEVAGNANDVNVSSTATIGSVKIAGQFNGQATSGTVYHISAGVINKFQVGSAVYDHAALHAGVNFNTIGLASVISAA